MKIISFVFVFFCITTSAFATESFNPVIDAISKNFIGLSVIVFTTIALILSSILMWRNRVSGQDILRTFGIISIVGISGVLMIIGYGQELLTPVVGLFGAIAGYLLGKDNSHNSAP